MKFSPELAAQITALAHDSVTARDLVSVLLVEAIAARNAENAATVAV